MLLESANSLLAFDIFFNTFKGEKENPCTFVGIYIFNTLKFGYCDISVVSVLVEEIGKLLFILKYFWYCRFMYLSSLINL